MFLGLGDNLQHAFMITYTMALFNRVMQLLQLP